MRLIETEADVAEGAAWLADRFPPFAMALDRTGPWPLRRRPEGFTELFRTIVYQQVSLTSAGAVWARAEAAGITTEAGLLAAPEETLIAVGLTRAKQRYARALAEARIDYAGLHRMSDEAAAARLMEVPGIGRWTAEIYVTFSLGRPDVMAAGDIALQEGTRQLFSLPARPKEKELRDIAAAWSPWRSVAARGLWAYYLKAKNWEGEW